MALPCGICARDTRLALTAPDALSLLARPSVTGLEIPLPRLEQPLDVVALRVGELEAGEQSPRFGRIVVRDRGLEVLTERRRLAKLPA